MGDDVGTELGTEDDETGQGEQGDEEDDSGDEAETTSLLGDDDGTELGTEDDGTGEGEQGDEEDDGGDEAETTSLLGDDVGTDDNHTNNEDKEDDSVASSTEQVVSTQKDKTNSTDTLLRVQDVVRLAKNAEDLRKEALGNNDTDKEKSTSVLGDSYLEYSDDANRRHDISSFLGSTDDVTQQYEKNKDKTNSTDTLLRVQDVVRLAKNAEDLRKETLGQLGGKENNALVNKTLLGEDSEAEFKIVLMDLKLTTEDNIEKLETLLKDKSIWKEIYDNDTKKFESIKTKINKTIQDLDINNDVRYIYPIIQEFNNSIENYRNNAKVSIRENVVNKFKKVANVLAKMIQNIDKILSIFKDDYRIKRFISEKSRIETIHNLKMFEMFLRRINEDVEEKQNEYLKRSVESLEALKNLYSYGYSIKQDLRRRGMVNNGQNEKLKQEVDTIFEKLKGDNNYAKEIFDNIGELKNEQYNHFIRGFANIIDRLTAKSQSSISKVVTNSNNGDTLYSRIWNKYTTDTKDDNKLLEDSQDKLYKSYKTNNLDPSDVLSPTLDDKIIFIIISFAIRQIVLTIVETMIDSGIITNLYSAIIYYIIFYISILFVIIIIVNLDDYKFRILLNYFNLHGNLYGIFGHITVFASIFLVLYILIYNMNPSIHRQKPSLTEVEKINLNYKLELISISVFAVVASMELIFLL